MTHYERGRPFQPIHGYNLTGHCDGLEDVAMDSGAMLTGQLNKLELATWFDLYRSDLRALWDRRGKWTSMDEFLVLGHHVERLLWPFGLFLWQTPEGNCRVEAPLYIDEQTLRVESQKHPPRAPT